MKIWKALAGIAGVAAAAALIPYQVEKDGETGATTVKALAWTAVKAPVPEKGGTKVDVTFLPGLASEEPARGIDIDIDIDITPDAKEPEETPAEQFQAAAEELLSDAAEQADAALHGESAPQDGSPF